MKKKETEKQKRIDWEKYRRFVEQVDIDNIRLISANIKLLDEKYFPAEAEAKTGYKAEFENNEDGFYYIHHFHLFIKDRPSKENKAKIFLAIRVDYSSKIAMNEELNEIFTKRNLFINTWPYFREFANSITSRFGWPPYIAAVYQA